MNKLNELIGENEENVIRYMQLKGFDYHIVYTKSPKTGEDICEKRVIRLKMKNNNNLEILVGYFKPPVA